MVRFSVVCCLFLLTACGGRKLDAVSIERDTDSLLSCQHLLAEINVNNNRFSELSGERSKETDNNISWFLVAPIFMDLSGTEKKEIEALRQRNIRLIELMKEKSCPHLSEVKPEPKI